MVTSGSISKGEKKDSSSQVKIFFSAYAGIILIFLLIGPWAFSSTWVSSSDFHASIEIASSFIALIAAVACMMYFFGLKSRYYLIIGLGFFICGSEDMIHGFFSFHRLFAGTGVDFSRFIPGTYVAGRSILAITIIIAALLETRMAKLRASQIKREALIFSLVALVLGGGATAFVFSLPLPQFIFPDAVMSRPVDFVSAVLFMIALVLVLKRYLLHRDIFSGMLAACVLLNIGGQIYMSFSKQLFDIFFDIAHIANIVSYCIPMLGISVQGLEEINQRTLSEELLQTEKWRLSEIIEGTNAGTWEWNIPTGECSVNDRWAAIAGYTLDEISPLSIDTVENLTHPDDLANIIEILEKHFKRELDYYVCEFRVRNKNGDWVWVLDKGRVATWTDDGRPLLMAGTRMDFTDRKQAEEKLKTAKDQAESANRAKSEFLANMSHEIRTPMNAMLGFSNLMHNIVTDKQQKNYLDSIQTAGKGLLTLINDILDLSKIEAGRLELQYEAINPLAVFKAMEQIFGTKIADLDLEFIIDIAPDLPPALMLDEIRVRPVLFNLIGNAVKFTKQGHIKLSAYKLDKTDSSFVDLVFIVEDTGTGIAEEQSAIIFEAFVQQDGQRIREYGGTGLGLTISKRLVEMMSGYITLTSAINKGSIFVVTLENVEVARVGPSANTSTVFYDLRNIAFETTQVLIVDDIDSNRRLIKESLSLAGLEVIEAVNGQEAVEMAKEVSPGMIIMDIRMPVMDGFEAAKKIKTNPKTKDIPIIALTASAGIEHTRKIEQSAFDEHLSKPVSMGRLFEYLAKYLKHTLKEAEENARPTSSDGDTAENIKDIPELLKSMKNQIMPEWEALTGVMEMDEVEAFAKKLADLATRHNAASLLEYTENLIMLIQSFDIEQIEISLKRLPGICDEMEKLA